MAGKGWAVQRRADMGEGDEVLAVVGASAARRALMLAMVWGLAALLLWLALTHPPAAPVFRVLLAGLGAGALWGGELMRRATALTVELTGAGLVSSDGEVIARWDEIETVDRGTFAFKPSNGFIVGLAAKAPLRWRPGLWWRWGRRVGIGGVTPGAQARVMADIIAARLQAAAPRRR